MEADRATPLAEHRNLLREFLQSCDLVKFARYQPTLAELETGAVTRHEFCHGHQTSAFAANVGAGLTQRGHEMSQIEFAYPWVLALLLLLPVLAILRGHRGKAPAIEYSGLSLFSGLGRVRRVQAGGWLSALRYFVLAACCIVALARPQHVDSSTQVQESGIDMILAIDLSPSMEALDYHKDGEDISRVQVVRETVGNFIKARPNDRIGMVVFSGEAYT